MSKKRKDLFHVKHELLDKMNLMTEVSKATIRLANALQTLGFLDPKDEYQITPLLRSIDKFQLRAYKKIREESLK